MMKKALFQTGCLLTSLTMFSSVFATAEGIEKVLFAKKEETLSPVAQVNDGSKNSTCSCDCTGCAKSLSKAFTKVAKKATPSVVHIRVESTPEDIGSDPNGFFNDEFFRRFFEMPNQPQRQPQPQLSQGSGFIITSDGYVMTNYHVVASAKKITVVIEDETNQEYSATMVGGDPQTDIAIIKLDNPQHKVFPFLSLGDSDNVEICEFVIAIGNPFQLEASVTVGVISAKGRQNLKITELEDFIQTDAAINPGNSGGPLLNLDGEVIGINTAIVSRSGGYMGIGFAIPSNMAKIVSKQLIDTGSVTRGFLGVSLQPIDKDLAEALGLDKPEGALVADVVTDSPAAKAGVMQGDIILEINGIAVKGPASLKNDVMLNQPGSEVSLKINRKGKIVMVKVTLGSYNKNTLAASENSQLLGINVQNITPETIKAFRLNPNEEGVVITDVKRGSLGGKIGLKPGFVIVSLNHKKVTNVESFNEALGSIEKGKKILMLVKASDTARFFSLTIN